MHSLKILYKISRHLCNIPMIRICEIDIMFINIYRNPKTRNWFRYETFIHLFEFKGFSIWGERYTIFLCWLLLHRQLSTQTTRGARSAQIRLRSPNLNLDSLVRRQELNSLLFLKSPKSSAHASGAWRHSRPLV